MTTKPSFIPIEKLTRRGVETVERERLPDVSGQPYEGSAEEYLPVPRGGGQVVGDSMDELNRLHILSAEASDLRAALAKVQSGKAQLSSYAEYIQGSAARMQGIVSGLEGDDGIRHIRNAFEQLNTSKLIRNPEAEYPAQEQMQLLSSMEDQCRQLVFWSGYRTIPERLREWLAASQPGYAIPFHAVFQDEMPDAEDRQKILDHLSWRPAILREAGGMIDSDSGLVFRYDRDTSIWRQLASVIWIFAAIAVGAIVIALIATQEPLNHSDRVIPHLLTGWAALLVGMLVSMCIGITRRIKSQGPLQSVMPMSRVLIMLNVRIGFIVFRLFVGLVGYFALLYTIGMPAEIATFIFNAFLVGYSLDSVVEMLGSSLDQQASSAQRGLKGVPT